ncbi:MAG: heat-inducible transcriptional repressor HrcA [Burkholderiales bacterium]|nr:heat-inducible transcriptional repressor HrcA [Pseudomonadota bacterium]MCC7066942.1 heat-inducible transcriptional repressor HrcA [Burkholderiales bacterium]
MLDPRSRILLKALVERYIADGEPVGSRTLSKQSGLELSPATIRNVMADLEEHGFIASPHTSAGRVPTPRGYRFFVDTLLVTQALDRVEVQGAEAQMHGQQPQELIGAAARLLSELSSFAGIVAAPHKTPAFRHIEFVRLGERRLLMVLVAADGDVQNRILNTDRAFSPAQLTEAANFFNERFGGVPLDQVRARLTEDLQRLREDIMVLMTAAVATGSELAQQASDNLIVSGERRLLHTPEASGNLGSLRQLFDLFEQRTQLLHLFDLANKADGVQIFIGGESQVVPLDEFSLVTAPYQVNGEVIGTLGVIGPTRMAYDRVIPIVDLTAKLLSSALQRELGETS